MAIELVQPAHCAARAQRLLGELKLVREELGRTEDTRPLPEITGAAPREVYFEALAAWHKVDRLAAEVGAQSGRPGPVAPAMRDLSPGHVLVVIDAVLATLDDVKHELGMTEHVAEPAIEAARQPSDVLVALVRANRELSRVLERPFTPSDVYRTVALASAYAARLKGSAMTPELAPFERGRRPIDCYQRLEACLTKASHAVLKQGQTALSSRGTLTDVQPSDVFDLASLVLGEVAFLHALSPTAAPVHAFEPGGTGYRLPSDVYQLARTLEAQL